MAGPFDDFLLYRYNPSLAAAVVFIILFFASTCIHTYQLARARAWYFIPFVIGGLFEFIGYIGRAVSSTESPNWTTGPYVCQSLLILLAIPFFSATIYMILGRIIRLTDGEHHSIISTRWLTKLFVIGDVLSFLTQSSGGGLLATAKDANKFKLGEWVIIGGLIIQIIFFSIFVLVAVVFHSRMTNRPTARSKYPTLPWQSYILVLYAASGLILIRSIVRVVEYVQGNDGEIQKHEWYLYVFDATLMFIVMVLFNVWHPNKIITKENLTRTASDVEAHGTVHTMVDRSTHGPLKT